MVKNKINGYSLLLTGNFALNYSNIFGTDNNKNKRCGKCSPKKELTTSEASELEEKQKKQKEENDKKINALNNKIQELLNAQDQLKSENMNTVKQFEFNKAENDKKINDLNQIVNNLKTDITKKDNEVTEKLSKITEENKQAVDNLKKQYEDVLKENEDLQKKISDNDNKIENFKKQQEDLNKQLEAESADKAKIEDDINNLKTQINNLETQNNKDKEDKEKKDEEVKKALEDLNKKNDEVYGEINKLKQEVSIIKNINKENENIIKNLKNIESNYTNIKQIETSEGLKLNFINNKKNISKTKEGKYSYNSIIYLTEQIAQFKQVLSQIDLNNAEDAEAFNDGLGKFVTSTGENIFKALDFDAEKVSNNLVLQFDFVINNMTLSEFLQNYIILDEEMALNCLKTYLTSSKSVELYFDDISFNKKFTDKIKPEKSEENCIYIDDIKDFIPKFNDSPNPSRYSYNEFLFSTLYLDLIKFKNDDALKNIEEIVKLEKENAKLENDNNDLHNKIMAAWGMGNKTYKEKELLVNGYKNNQSDNNKKKEENNKKIIELSGGHSEQELILNELSVLLYKLTGEILTKDQIGEIATHFDDENYNEYLLNFFITNYGDKKIKDGNYHIIFNNISEGFGNFSIVRS